MDEPCSALDPDRDAQDRGADAGAEEAVFTIAIVTHNLQQAKRVADTDGFLYVDTTQGGPHRLPGEFGITKQIFENQENS